MTAGALNEVMSAYEEALRLAQEFDLRLIEAILYQRSSQMHMYLGDWASVYRFAQQASTIYQALQYLPGKFNTSAAFMMYAYAVGDYEQVLRWSQQLMTQCEMHHIHEEIELAAYAYHGKAQIHRAEREQAYQSLVVAVERSEELGHRAYEAWTKIALGELLLAQGAWQEVQALGEAALALTTSPDAAAYRMAAQTLMALLYWRRQDWRGAAVYQKEIDDALTAGRLATQQEVPWICLTGHALWTASGDERAHAFIAYGQAWLQSQAAKISDEIVRQAFLQNVPEHRSLLVLARPTTVHN
jgi:tetratricopeptide (TPR) repeat protein